MLKVRDILKRVFIVYGPSGDDRNRIAREIKSNVITSTGKVTMLLVVHPNARKLFDWFGEEGFIQDMKEINVIIEASESELNDIMVELYRHRIKEYNLVPCT